VDAEGGWGAEVEADGTAEGREGEEEVAFSGLRVRRGSHTDKLRF
jgi:hypothetical protein